ncbi:MAG TPA: hypothetical protein VHE35_04215 [Kofleriaceae bacterium]|nr:hypothetical protein [Kofleriaceae bacterium]
MSAAAATLAAAAPGVVDEAQRDAIAEMVNIGMGQAGASLARLFDAFIKLSVPRVQLVEPDTLADTLDALCGRDTPVTVARQAFASRIRGEAIVFFTSASAEALGELVAFNGASTDELLLDVTNVLVGACIGGLAEQFGLDVGFSPPSLLGRRACATAVLAAAEMDWRRALLAEVNFRVEGRAFRCHLLTFWPDASLAMLIEAADALLATI